MLNRAWELSAAIARGLGGTVAGDPRRWCDTSHDLAVVVAGDVDQAIERFAELPEIVTVVDGTLGITVDGVPVRLVVAPPSSFGTELLRATGSSDYVAALGELPAAATEDAVFAALGLPFVPPELRE